jgi:hypothetical protein
MPWQPWKRQQMLERVADVLELHASVVELIARRHKAGKPVSILDLNSLRKLADEADEMKKVCNRLADELEPEAD